MAAMATATKAALKSGMISVLIVGAAGCGPYTIESLGFCGRMLQPGSNHLMRSGEARYHALFSVNGVDYDSDHYGPIEAQVDSKGWACFNGGVGPNTLVRDFKLKSMTVVVTDEQGRQFTGEAADIRWGYYGNTRKLHASARFALQPSDSTSPDVSSPDAASMGTASNGAASLVDESGEPGTDAVVSGERVVP
jgi:hypothetical protein